MPLVTNSAHLIAPFIALFETITEKVAPGVEAFLAACSFDAFSLLRASAAALAGRDKRIFSTCQDGFSCYLAAFF